MNSNKTLPSMKGLGLRAAIVAAFASAVAGCARVEGGSGAAPAATDDPQVRVVAESTQAAYQGLRIGVGYVRSGEYAEGGAAKKGKVAGLWLYFRDDASKNVKIEVHAGQKVEAGGYSFTVEDVSGGLKGSVRLRFEPGPGQ